MTDSFSIHGKIAIITGAGSGIGRGIAKVLANNGAKVVVVDIDETLAKNAAEQIRQAGNISTPIAADVSSWADMQKVAAATVKEYSARALFFGSALIEIWVWIDQGRSKLRLTWISFTKMCYTVNTG
jgi:NAD(P)-dependent dehydrogenase (short-subunit alcohol dehydrogenase family)